MPSPMQCVMLHNHPLGTTLILIKCSHAIRIGICTVMNPIRYNWGSSIGPAFIVRCPRRHAFQCTHQLKANIAAKDGGGTALVGNDHVGCTHNVKDGDLRSAAPGLVVVQVARSTAGRLREELCHLGNHPLNREVIPSVGRQPHRESGTVGISNEINIPIGAKIAQL